MFNQLQYAFGKINSFTFSIIRGVEDRLIPKFKRHQWKKSRCLQKVPTKYIFEK